MHATSSLIQALSYVVITTPRLAEWCGLATNIVGLQAETVVP